MFANYGTLALKNGKWELDKVPPHVCIKLKAVFESIPKSKAAPFVFDHTPANCSDLFWFTSRYNMEMSDADRELLMSGKAGYDTMQAELNAIFMPDYVPQNHKFKDGKAERDYQATARELFLKVKALLCGDDLGLGKTTIALGAWMHAETLPAIVVVETHNVTQWVERIKEFTHLTSHVIKQRQAYSLPTADVYIITYSKLAAWVNIFSTKFFKSVTYDEIQNLRIPKSQKYQAAEVLRDNTIYSLGLSATPIFNYGNEMYHIMNLLKKGCLSEYGNFMREWTTDGLRIKNPEALGTYLRSEHLFIRRTRKEVGRELPPVNKIVHTVDFDNGAVESVEELARQLSIKVLNGTFHERGEASRELDTLLRQATGVGKAKSVAAFVKILLDGGETVILSGWHREVYRIWLEELKQYKPLMYTGSESPVQKEKNKKAFINGESKLLVISLRSGAGVDGWQDVCNVIVHGELDWSPKVTEQLTGRLNRDGQAQQVNEFFLVSDEGSDPTVMKVLGLKASQSTAIIDPTLPFEQVHTDESRIKMLAQNFLNRKIAVS